MAERMVVMRSTKDLRFGELYKIRMRLRELGYSLHHSSYTGGYVSRKKPLRAELYEGRFGNGYIVDYPIWYSTRYHVRFYFIKKEVE